MDMSFENIVAPHNINFGVGGDGEPLMEGNKYVPLVSGLRFANITGIAHPRCDFSAACKHSNGARNRRGCASVALHDVACAQGATALARWNSSVRTSKAALPPARRCRRRASAARRPRRHSSARSLCRGVCASTRRRRSIFGRTTPTTDRPKAPGPPLPRARQRANERGLVTLPRFCARCDFTRLKPTVPRPPLAQLPAPQTTTAAWPGCSWIVTCPGTTDTCNPSASPGSAATVAGTPRRQAPSAAVTAATSTQSS